MSRTYSSHSTPPYSRALGRSPVATLQHITSRHSPEHCTTLYDTVLNRVFVGELVFVGIGYVGGGCLPNVVLCLQAGESCALFRMFGSNGGEGVR